VCLACRFPPKKGKIQQKKRTNHAAIVHAHSFAVSALCGMLAAIGAGTQPRLLDASGVADPAGIAVTFDDANLHTISTHGRARGVRKATKLAMAFASKRAETQWRAAVSILKPDL